MNRHRLLTELKALSDAAYREEYLNSLVHIGLSAQVRALRGSRTQQEFASIVGLPQSVISERLENPHYTGTKISTLVGIANRLEIGLLVRFVSYPELLLRTEDASEEALRVPTISESLQDQRSYFDLGSSIRAATEFPLTAQIGEGTTLAIITSASSSSGGSIQWPNPQQSTSMRYLSGEGPTIENTMPIMPKFDSHPST